MAPGENMHIDSKIVSLMEKGVKIPSPSSVVISDDVDISRISGSGVVINPGCMLKGSGLYIGDGTIVGSEGPMTLENVAAARKVTFASGYARDAVFLSDASVGANAHIREGCLFEELSGTAHTVGLKQTILFPFVTLGSLINFCDCLMSGGTSRKNHSEVGSSYIHFNYTPNQDKATPSIMGNVPDGVMLDKDPVFLGGQGGMVGPCRIAFGTVISAGSICRKDILHEGRLISEVHGRSLNIQRKAGFYSQVKRTVFNNIFYIANLMALSLWYRNVRTLFISDAEYPEAVHSAALKTIDTAIKERKKRFNEFCMKMPESMDVYLSYSGENASPELLSQKNELFRAKDDILSVFSDSSAGDFSCHEMDFLVKSILKSNSEKGGSYIDVIGGLDADSKIAGSVWLWNYVKNICKCAFDKMPLTGLDIKGGVQKIGENNV